MPPVACGVLDRVHGGSCERVTAHEGWHYVGAWWFTVEGVVVYDARMPAELIFSPALLSC